MDVQKDTRKKGKQPCVKFLTAQNSSEGSVKIVLGVQEIFIKPVFTTEF